VRFYRRNSWVDGAIAGKKKLERLRAFFRFALQSNWVKHNPVLSIRSPKVSQPPTLPFSGDEIRSKAGVEERNWNGDFPPIRPRSVPRPTSD
jgi:site-specific recombinase XerD